MKKILPILLTDFYKISHREQYPKGTEVVYSTWTARTSRIKGIDKVIAFGFQAFIKEYLIDYFNENFFNRDLAEIKKEYIRFIKNTLNPKKVDTKHIEDLHELGYLPLEISAIEEGTLVPIRVPMLTIKNTNVEFFWVTNFIETLLSCQLWQSITSATLANEYKKILNKYALMTSGNIDFVNFQGHDFSMRGMSSVESAALSGAGHLLSFVGTDTIPAIHFLENYYNADIEKELVGTSIPATEHSVQCAYGQDKEFEAYENLITNVYPKGFVSIVSDTWDIWSVLNNIIKPLKDKIMARDGKVVIRPDSGDPVDIICGDIQFINSNNYGCKTLEDCEKFMKDHIEHDVRIETPHGECGVDTAKNYFKFHNKYYEIEVSFEWNRYDKQYYFIDGTDIEYCKEIELSPKQKGVVEILWDIFGRTINEKGYKELDSHIGVVYGDAITLERCEEICKRLEEKGFASTNVVFGIGSYTYQYNTRDTFGFALKSTYAVINGEPHMLFKDPITDDGIKKSQKGLVYVYQDSDNQIKFEDGFTNENEIDSQKQLLKLIFINGAIFNETSLSKIRNKIKGE